MSYQSFFYLLYITYIPKIIEESSACLSSLELFIDHDIRNPAEEIASIFMTFAIYSANS